MKQLHLNFKSNLVDAIELCAKDLGISKPEFIRRLINRTTEVSRKQDLLQMVIDVSDEEYAHVKEFSRRANLSMSEAMRKVCIGYLASTTTEYKLVEKIAREWCNSPSPPCDECLETIQALVDKIHAEGFELHHRLLKTYN